MGAPLSEPATLADLVSCIHRLHTDRAFAARTGLHYHNTPTEEVVQGLLYVDDSLTMSRIV